MAKLKSSSVNSLGVTKKKRSGVHSKTKTSKNMKSQNYKKKYRGQGR